jgi:hypothetical protein
MDLDLEIVLGVEDLTEGEILPPAPPAPALKTVRRSHQLAARMLAQGTNVQVVAAHVGMAPSRLYVMMQNDPTFQELIAAHSAGFDADEEDLQRQSRLAAGDFLQHAYEKVFEHGEEISFDQAMEAYKIANDRGGNAPVSRSLSKSLNVNLGVGDALDRIKRLKEAQNDG